MVNGSGCIGISFIGGGVMQLADQVTDGRLRVADHLGPARLIALVPILANQAQARGHDIGNVTGSRRIAGERRSGAMPPMLDHYLAVDYWIRSLDDRVSAYVPMQDAGLFPAGEFVDAHVAA